jgi:hypothetical protein
MIILTNGVFFWICIRCSNSLRSHSNPYATHMSRFVIWLGISAAFGAVAHSIHFQLGSRVFNTVFYLMNACSLLSIYYCFNGSYEYIRHAKGTVPLVKISVAVWVIVLLVLAAIYREFVLIKIHAGAVLFFSLIVHMIMKRRNEWRGNRLFIAGIFFSFMSVIIHSLRITLHEWFNYKDISHVFMIIALLFMWPGMRSISAELTAIRTGA